MKPIKIPTVLPRYSFSDYQHVAIILRNSHSNSNVVAMANSNRTQIAEYVQEIIDELSLWSHVDTDERHSGSTEFRIGPRSIGHVHRWGIVETEDDIDDALQLLRLSYLIQVQTLKWTPTGQDILADIDVEAELDSLDVFLSRVLLDNVVEHC